jgi:hypothetical protein
MEDLITYDPQGVGEQYGVQYHGEDLIKFLKAIHYLVCEKKMNMPLPSHHGITFKMTKFNCYLTLLNNNWTHKTKGNGCANIRLVWGSDFWCSTLDKNGNSVKTDRALLKNEVGEGFKKAIERAGFSLKEIENNYLFGHNLNEEANFVSNILPPQVESTTYQPDISNPDYPKVFEDFLVELKKIFEYYSVIS